MNKFIKNSLKLLVAGVALFGLCKTAKAHGDFDWYALDKDVQLIALCSNGVAGATGTNTSQPILVGKGIFIGSGFVDVYFMTNWGTNTGNVSIQTSPDTTNWTYLTNVSYATNISSVFTNTYYDGTNGTSVALVNTNYELNPTVSTTPNSALAGFATSYPNPGAGLLPFTNVCSNAVVNYTGPTNSTVGYYSRYGIQNIADLQTYLRVSIGYSGTNYFSATFHGRRSK